MTTYTVYDTRTGDPVEKRVNTYATRRQANRLADSMNQAYGAHRYAVRTNVPATSDDADVD